MSRGLYFKTLSALLLVLLAGASVFWLAFSPRAGGPSQYTVAGPSDPYGLYAPGTLDEVPPSSANELLGALGLNTIADYQDYTLGLIQELGVTWARIDFLFDGNEFMIPGSYLDLLEVNNIEVVGCPRAFVPLDAAALSTYREKLGELVASRPSIRVWQIDNEPNIGSGSPDSYLDIFFAGREAVVSTCPDCRIALAGVAVLNPGRQESLDYFDALLAGIAARYAGDGRPFDVFDLHYYGLAGESEALVGAYGDYAELLNKHGLGDGVRFWMTECATYAGHPLEPPGLPAQSEEQQAEELVKRFVAVLGAGAERVSWSRFYENYNYTGVMNGYYDHSGIIYNGLGDEARQGVAAGTRKAAFGAYRLLVDKTDGYAGVSRIAPGQYRFDFADGPDAVYVIWAVEGTTLAPELAGPVRYTDIDGNVYESDALTPGEAPLFVTRL